MEQNEFIAGQLQFRWENNKSQWAASTDMVLYVGKWPIGKVMRTATARVGGNNQGAFMKLPGVKDLLGHYKTQEEAQMRVEAVAKYWFTNLNTKGK